MDCDRLFEEILEDEGGSLSSSMDVRRHLEQCPRCRDLRDSLRIGRTQLRSHSPAPAPPDFFLRLQNRIQAYEQRRLLRRRQLAAFARVSALTGVAVAAFLVVSVVLQELHRPARLADGSGSESRIAQVAVLRPFARMLGEMESSLFDHRFDASRDWLSEAFAPGTWLNDALPVGTSRGQLPARTAPVLYATPSLTFAAAPVSIHFVSSLSPAGPSFEHPAALPYPGNR
jgi:hypothetical protein